jgi:hypothetical protein
MAAMRQFPFVGAWFDCAPNFAALQTHANRAKVNTQRDQ